jgi:hypothetical protein
MPPTNAADYWEKRGVAGLISRAALRTLQFAFAIVVAVLYGLDLQQATNNNAKAESAWIYAEFVAGVSMVVCLAHLFFTTAVWYWGLLDGLVFVLWLAQFGVFATTYLGGGEKLEEDGFAEVVSSTRMRSAVWVNLVSMLLWLATTIQGIIGCCARRKNAQRKDREMELVSVNEP